MNRIISCLLISICLALASWSAEVSAQDNSETYIVYYTDIEKVNTDRIASLGAEVLHSYEYLPALLVKADLDQVESIRLETDVKYIEENTEE